LDVSNSTEEDRKKESAEVEFKTEILDKPEQIIKQITHLAESSSGLSIVSVYWFTITFLIYIKIY